MRLLAPFFAAASSYQMRTCRYCGKNGNFYPIVNHEIHCKIERICKAARERAAEEERNLETWVDSEFYRNLRRNRKERWAKRNKEMEKASAVHKDTQNFLDAQSKRKCIRDTPSEYFLSEEDGEYYSSDSNSCEPELSTDYAWMDDAAGHDSHCGYDFSRDVRQESQENFIVLKEPDIKRRQKDDVSHTSILLSISKGSAFMLLHHYSWSVNNAIEAWFDNEAGVRMSAGLLEQPYNDGSKAKNILCQICLTEVLIDKTTEAPCGHRFCNKCWKGYIQTSIDSGPECLTLGCAIPSCHVALGVDFIRSMVKDKKKFEQFMFRSYVEGNAKMKWCPARDCTCAIEFLGESSESEVTCSCSHSFCWICNVEAHRPVDCQVVTKWLRNKNSAEAHSLYWIALNSKACPQCKKPIEKDQGCVHMKCKPPCNFEFCWLCLGPWSDHGPNTGGFFSCNRFEAAKRAGMHDQDTKRKVERASYAVRRYNHYYERWATNQTAQEKALADMHKMQNVNIPELSDKYCQTLKQLDFILRAYVQIVDCRRILKWTYAYAFYSCKKQSTKTTLFSFLQGRAEDALERLHYCAEIEIQSYLCGDIVSQEVFYCVSKQVGKLDQCDRQSF